MFLAKRLSHYLCSFLLPSPFSPSSLPVTPVEDNQQVKSALMLRKQQQEYNACPQYNTLFYRSRTIQHEKPSMIFPFVTNRKFSKHYGSQNFFRKEVNIRSRQAKRNFPASFLPCLPTPLLLKAKGKLSTGKVRQFWQSAVSGKVRKKEKNLLPPPSRRNLSGGRQQRSGTFFGTDKSSREERHGRRRGKNRKK